MALPKLYEQITWVNDTTPALNEDNLNAMSQALDDIDDRVIDLAGTIMEDVPQIQEDLAILEPAIENIDENVARAEAAADSAEQYAEEIAPPIEVVKDFAPIVTIEDAINKAAKDVKVKVDAVQDLHGYTKPWVGGAGKNKLPTTLAILKEANTAGTWVDNVYTYQGVTFTVISDDGGNVTAINTNGTSSAAFSFRLRSDNTLSFTEETILSGCPSGGGSSTYALVKEPYSDVGSGVNMPANSAGYMYIRVQAASVNMSGKVFKPMIRLSTVSDATFEPYTNICPITGHSEVNITRQNEDASISDVYTISLGDTRYGGTLDVDAGTLTLTHGYADLGDLTWDTAITAISGKPRMVSSDIISTVKKPSSDSTAFNGISSQYVAVSNNAAYNNLIGCGISAATGKLYVYDDRYTDAATFKTAMDGVQLVYELATPQTITLTAEEVTLLLGYNTLFADTGDISLKYDASGVLRIANAKLDIDTFKSVVAASSDFADFKSRVAAL